jgi:hypothetical protein
LQRPDHEVLFDLVNPSDPKGEIHGLPPDGEKGYTGKK